MTTYPSATPPLPPSGGSPTPPPGGGGDGQSAIAVTAKFMWLAWFFALLKPKLFVNGHELAAVWGRNVVPLPPGQHRVQLHVPYFLPPKVGEAEQVVSVAPGQTVELEYRAPVFGFSPGALGAAPQKWNGLGITVGLMIGVVVVLCGCCGLSIIANALS